MHAAPERGELVEILRAFKTDGHVISAVFPKEEPYSPKIRAFVDFLARQFDPPLDQASATGQEDVRRIRRKPRRAAVGFFASARAPGSEKGAPESYPHPQCFSLSLVYQVIETFYRDFPNILHCFRTLTLTILR
jgi:hypothetical protein